MNTAYKHLDAKLKIASLSATQWCGVAAGVGAAIVWGGTLHPLSGMLNTITSVYIGGIPAFAAWFCAEAEIDLPMRARALVRWRRGQDRYLPGASEPTPGYRVRVPEAARPARARDTGQVSPSLEGLWR